MTCCGSAHVLSGVALMCGTDLESHVPGADHTLTSSGHHVLVCKGDPHTSADIRYRPALPIALRPANVRNLAKGRP